MKRKIDEKLIREIISENNIVVSREDEYKGGQRLILDHCLFDDSHKGTSAAIIIPAKGTPRYRCQHNSCANNSIYDVVKKYKPGFFDNSRLNSVSISDPISLDTVENVEEEAVEWLVDGYIPKAQITLIGGDGGTGKTSIWCDVVASVTNGRDSVFGEGFKRPDKDLQEHEPENAMFFSSEDSVPKVLKARLKAAGADLKRVSFLDLTDKNFERIKFGSEELEALIEKYRPAVVVFDPLQSFIPPEIQMGSRNAMRQCMSPLIGLGEKYGTTFIIILHTNKKQGVSGRQRIADSSDIWDISRSVLIAGVTGDDDMRYLSHEKCNYAELAPTILYTIESGRIVFKGTSTKRDADYVRESRSNEKAAPSLKAAKDLILDYLKDGRFMLVSDLDTYLKSMSVSFATLKRAKSELKDQGILEYRNKGFGDTKIWYIRIKPEHADPGE